MAQGLEQYVKRDPRTGVWRYYRRIPSVIPQEPGKERTHIKHSLKTKDFEVAVVTARRIHDSVEALWKDFIAGNDNKRSWERHEDRVRLAQALGYVYKPLAGIVAGPLDEQIARTFDARAQKRVAPAVESILGTEPDHDPRIDEVWELYEKHNSSGLAGLSPRQLSKHKVPRERALKYLRDLLGNVRLSEINRASVLRFREWWTTKVQGEGLRAYTANRSFTDIKGMLAVIDNALNTSFHAVWDKVRIKETNKTKLRKRMPFPVEFVQDKILAPGALDNLNLDARLIVYTMVETGLRLGEVCNLRPEDIHLDGAIPHIEVADREDRRQKTDYSIRRIPLVGVSLWAMKQAPAGFPRYQDKADTASAIINKMLDTNGLRPTPRHTVYSLRHTFQDRIENAGASDRMQADLMGHEFGRPVYGDGAEMKRRHALLDGIKFRWEVGDKGAP